MLNNKFKFRAKIWLYSGIAAWHFISLPQKQSDTIKKTFGAMKRGWGSLPVSVTIGKTTWKTSIFPDKKANAYLLPLKTEVRKKENLRADDAVTFTIEIRV